MATGAADGFFRCVYEGSISHYDNGVERRPYHRNCGCALHSKSGNKKSSTHRLCNNVSYPMRRSWSEGSLTLMASASSSPSSSPAAAVNCIGFGSGKPQSTLTDLEEKEENN